MQTHRYRGLQFDVPMLAASGLTFAPEKCARVLPRADASTWDPERYARPSAPARLGAVSDPAAFSRPRGVRVLDMPVKLAGSSVYRLPAELRPWSDLVRQIATVEHASNPYVDECFAYLTIDQGVVRPGVTQRNGGCHVDGFQGARIAQKTRCNRSYVVSDTTPTVFYRQPFDLVMRGRLDAARHDFFAELDLQARSACEERSRAHEVMLMDAYTVHRADPLRGAAPRHRTFFRLTFDPKVFDRLGNTPNPMLPTGWEMIPRDVHESLVRFR